MVAAIKDICCLQPMSNDAAVTMLADWCQRLNSTFEAIKKMRLLIFDNFQTLIIFVAASLTSFHDLDASWSF